MTDFTLLFLLLFCLAIIYSCFDEYLSEKYLDERHAKKWQGGKGIEYPDAYKKDMNKVYLLIIILAFLGIGILWISFF